MPKEEFENIEDRNLGDFSTTFIKKNGIVDKGIDHDHIYISSLIFKYHVEYEDFCVSSNNKDFGSFGDVVIECTQRDKPGTETYALNFQLSPGKSTLKIKDLTLGNGNFNVKKYIEEIKNFGEDTKAIVYTDASLSVSDGQKIVLDSECCIVLWKQFTDWHIANGGIYGYRIELRQVDELLGTLYLYCGQDHIKKTSEYALTQFKNRLNSDDCSYDRFVDFIHNWSKIDGKKEKLTKRVLNRAAALSILAPFVKPLSFSPFPVPDNVKLFRDVISKFDVTIINDDSYNRVKKFWSDAKPSLVANIKKANRLRIRYQILAQPIKSVDDLDGKDVESSKLLWLMGKCPLVVYGNEKTFAALYLHIQDQFVVITSNTRLCYCTRFHTLSDLKVDPEMYEDVVSSFKCLTNSKKEVTLGELIEDNEQMKDVVTVDDLVRMVDGLVTM